VAGSLTLPPAGPQHELAVDPKTHNVYVATSDGLLVVDAAGKTTAHNAQLASLFTVPTDGSWQTLAGLAAQLADPEQLLARARSLGPADVSRDTLVLRDGRRVEARSRPHLVDGQVAGRVWSFRPAPPTT
jgi:hypothetical protein